ERPAGSVSHARVQSSCKRASVHYPRIDVACWWPRVGFSLPGQAGPVRRPRVRLPLGSGQPRTSFPKRGTAESVESRDLFASSRLPSMIVGSRLGPYEIVAPLGAGGMGEVYKARDTRLGRMVAIKILPPELANDVRRRERFRREAHAISSVRHAHICTLHD